MCSEPVLTAGDSVSFEIQVRAKGNLGDITNVVDVSASTTDSDMGNNHDELLMTVQGGTGDPGGPGGGRGRGVVVATDKARYCTSDPIIVRIANRLTETLYAYSGRSYCTIVDVERVDGDGAKPVGACVAGAPPSAVEITELSERRFELGRFDPVFEPMGPGAYRIRFCYRRGVAAAPETCIHSDEFAVRACAGGRAE